MALKSYYNTGTASVDNGSAAVTGQGTAWSTVGIKAGDFFVGNDGRLVPIASVDSNTSITLIKNWPGTTQAAAAYQIVEASAGARIIATTQALLEKLSGGNITAFAGLSGAANKVPYFTGAGTMALADLTAFGGGLRFTPGGDGVVSIYREQVLSAQNPRSATIDSVATDTITLTTSDASQFFDDDRMNGVSFARIWNTSKDPDESAWVTAQSADNQLQVTDAADISGWANGETIQIGDPGSGSGFDGRVIALDISPMQIALFGEAFRQTGIVVKAAIISGAEGDGIALTPDGSLGSFITAYELPSSAGVTIAPCTELSPISNSNLVLVRESISTTAGIRLVSSIGLFV